MFKIKPIDATDIFFFAGLGLSTYGIYSIIGAGYCMLWAGCIILAASIRA